MQEQETWRQIAGYPGYQISDQGRVRSIDRTITRKTKRGPVLARLKGRVLAVCMANSGYLVAMIGRARPYVHDLVLTAFVGERPAGYQAAHYNGDRRDNTPGNLRWASRSDNEADKLRHGTRLTGAMTSNGRKTSCKRGHQFELHEYGPGDERQPPLQELRAGPPAPTQEHSAGALARAHQARRHSPIGGVEGSLELRDQRPQARPWGRP